MCGQRLIWRYRTVSYNALSCLHNTCFFPHSFYSFCCNTHTRRCTHSDTHTHARWHVHTHAHRRAHTRAGDNAHECVRMHTAHTHTHTLVHTHHKSCTHTYTHTHTNAIWNSFDFSHSRRLGHQRYCWFQPAWARFYPLQRKQITTCIKFCIGLKIIICLKKKNADYHNRKGNCGSAVFEYW